MGDEQAAFYGGEAAEGSASNASTGKPLETASACAHAADAVSPSALPYLIVVVALIALSLLSWASAGCASNAYIAGLQGAVTQDPVATEGGEGSLSSPDAESSDATVADVALTPRSFLDSVQDHPELWGVNQAGIAGEGEERVTDSYPNSQQPILDFATSLLDADFKYTEEMQTHLHNAMASDEDELVANELALAIKAAQAAQDEMGAFAVPQVDQLAGAEVEQILESCEAAKKNALLRWSSTEYVLEFAANSSGRSLQELRYVDSWIASATASSADNLREALSSGMAS